MSEVVTPPPKISCLLPVFNGEQFLVEALNSILTQTRRDFELIVVDDGSTDRTSDILAQFAVRDPRIRIYRQVNGGIVSALNAGLALCRGEYVARMDADDISAVDRFAFQAEFLDDHPDCVLVGGVADSIRPDGRRGGRSSGGRHARTNLRPFPPKVAASLHPLIMMRRQALVAIGGYRNNFPHAEDYDLFIRLSRYGSIENPQRVVLTYRRHEGAISIRHLEQQEQSAAYAELDARRAEGLPDVQPWLLEAYIRLRIWRRYQLLDSSKVPEMTRKAIFDLINIGPRRLINRGYWRLRVLIAAALIRSAQRDWRRRRNARRRV